MANHKFADDRAKFSNDHPNISKSYQNDILYIKIKIDILNILFAIKQTCRIGEITCNMQFLQLLQ